ncbi:MAG: GIY-YIG nuclease family protein [Fimbriimonadaceae bacterium]
MNKGGFVYILASKKHGTLYIGVTSDLTRRIYEHKNNLIEGFTSKHGVHLLVWYEDFPTITEAIRQEKAIKAWKRDWKIKLIESNNPQWLDIYEAI